MPTPADFLDPIEPRLREFHRVVFGPVSVTVGFSDKSGVLSVESEVKNLGDILTIIDDQKTPAILVRRGVRCVLGELKRTVTAMEKYLADTEPKETS